MRFLEAPQQVLAGMRQESLLTTSAVSDIGFSSPQCFHAQPADVQAPRWGNARQVE